MVEVINVKAKRCTCDVCTHKWISIAKVLPAMCANADCRARAWNGTKKIGRPIGTHAKPKLDLPKPRRVRPIE